MYILSKEAGERALTRIDITTCSLQQQMIERLQISSMQVGSIECFKRNKRTLATVEKMASKLVRQENLHSHGGHISEIQFKH